MSSIDKLRIMGIRSFDNTRGEFIHFQAPLTLIVGFNGSGKTTIIECLKYATTGVFPPNSSMGKSFIHDPKLCGEKEVMGQVKLQLKDLRKRKIVVTRNVQLSVTKGGKTSLKTMDGTISIESDGHRDVHSYKTNDMNKPLLEFLGVSSAILDNVIYCHQDESMWPMSEPSILKKKFDEIFDAQKFTKAIDNLKLLRKHHTQQLALLKANEVTEKANKEKGERLLKKSDSLEAEIKVLDDQLADLVRQISAALDLKLRKDADAQKASTAVNDLETKTTQAQYLQTRIDELKSYIDELEESDAWLETTLAQYDERLAQYKEQELEYTTQYSELQKSLKDYSRQMSQKQAEKGQHQAQKEGHEKNLERRLQLVKEAARLHGIRGYGGDLDGDQIQDFLSRIAKAFRDKDRELERIKNATKDELQQAQASINDLKQRQASQIQEKNFARQGIEKNDKESRDKRQQMNLIEMNEGTKAVLETSRKDARDRLQKMTADFDTAGWDRNIQKEKADLEELKGESKQLVNELTRITNQSSARAQFDLAKKNVAEQRKSLDILKATHNDDLEPVLGADWRVDTLERELRDVIDQRARDVTNSRRKHEGVKDEYNNVEFKLKAAREELSKKKTTMKQCEKVVLDSIHTAEGEPLSSIDDYQTELENLEAERDGVRKDLDGTDHKSAYFNDCLKFLKEQNACKLCARNFQNDKEQSAALEKLKTLISKAAREELQKELEQVEEDLRKANTARSEYATYTSLKTEIAPLEKELKKLEASKSSTLTRLEQHDTLLNEAESAKSDVEALSDTARTISRCGSEIAKHEAEVTRLSSSQQILSGSSRSTDEIRQQMISYEEQIRALEAKLAKMTIDKEHATTARHELEKEVDAIASKVQKAQHELERKNALSSRIDELRENTGQLREAIRQADAELEALGPQVDTAVAQHDNVQQRGSAKEKVVQADKNTLSDTVNKLTNIEDNINKYIEEGGPGKLASCERAIKRIEQEQQQIEAEVNNVTQKANEMKTLTADSDKTRRSMADNIRYRKLQREMEEVQNQISELESRNVTDDWQQLAHEADKAAKLHQNLLGDRKELVGEIKAKNGQLEAYAKEWETDYKHAVVQYRKALVKSMATRAVTDDVAKVTKALDSAIMKYHSMKMEEINAIVGDLWQKTYQGTDIDTVMIRSEDDESVTTGRTAFKYRVVMVKQDTEMDMRGRCSAGQKVLACIIIRLALAECFGVNSGAIALDEPTTNLDQDNIEALAKSLHSIIQARKHQANFQLIIITHDEEFLKQMNCSDFTEYYYRVSRDEKQKSEIGRQSITGIL